MAKRYCGRLVIQLSYRDKAQDYWCTVSRAGERVGSVDVGAPAHLAVAVDSPEAYDNAAHAALSFLDVQQPEPADLSGAAMDGTGWAITRKRVEQ